MRTAGVVSLALTMPLLMGAGSASGPAPMPTAAGIRSAVVRLADWVAGRTQPKPGVPVQLAGHAPGRQHQVPAAVTRAVARAQGRAPGQGPGQLPAYAPRAAKVGKHVTGVADLGSATSYDPAASRLVAAGSTATSRLYRNADGSYTRLEYPVADSDTGAGTLTFAGVAGVGVKDTHVTSASLRVPVTWSTCPASATVTVSDSAGHRVGRWAGRPPASACGSGPAGVSISVPVSAAGLKELSSGQGATLTVAVTPAAAVQLAPAAPSPTPSASATGTTPAEPAATASPSAAGTAPAATPSPRVTTTPGSTASAPAAGVSPAGGGTAAAFSVSALRASPAGRASRAVAAGSAAPGGAVLMVTAAADGTPQVDEQWPSNGYDSPTLTPELIASGSDSYGSPLQYQFSVYDSAGTWLAASQWIAANDWVVPAGTLAWGQTYYWTAQAFDSNGNGSPDPQLFALYTPVPQPLVYSGMAQDGVGPGDSQTSGGPGYDPQNGNFTTSATDVSVPVTGPALSVQRTYNSLDPMATRAFGTGWTSVLDMRVSPGQPAADGSDATEVVTYPDGEQVAFGINADGTTYTPPQGRYGTLTQAPGGGFQLMDKSDTTYEFTQSLGSGSWGITSIADAQGHALDFTYSGGQVTQMKSAVSQRSLYLTWSTPSGADFPHVATVATDPVTPGDSSTAITWQYDYSGDQLTAACNESGSGQPCTAYSYQSGSGYPAAVLNSGPRSYWRLNEGSGSTAASSVLANEGTDNAAYNDVVQDEQPTPLAGSPSVGAAGFEDAYVRVPSSLADEAGAMSVSLWFNSTATDGVLFSQSADPVTGSTTTNPYSSLLYIGSDGKLLGGFAGTGTPLSSAAPVNDGNWHNVVLASCGTQEILYIDGAAVASKTVTVSPFIQPYIYLGAGFLGGSYPDEPHAGQSPAAATFFYGAMSDVGTWDRQLTAAEVSLLYATGTHPASLLTKITRPSGKVFEQASYDPVTSRVTHVTDANGGSWTVAAPAMSGSSQVYAASVEGAGPEDYWRLADTGTTTAVNQFAAGTAAYNDVTQGESGGPFSDTTVDGFNGSSSYLTLPDGLIGPGNQSVSLWFKTTATDGILLSSSADPVTDATTPDAFTPNLYIGDDGYLGGEFSYGDAPMGSAEPVNDGKWHNVILAAGTGDQELYLDGKQIGTVSAPVGGGTGDGEDHVYAGVGFLGGLWPDEPHYSETDPTGYRMYFNGDIAEVAVYPRQVTAADVTAQWGAAQHSPGLTPVETAQVTDPGGHTLTGRYDPLNSGRILSYTDGLGDTTSYGYDSAGFQGQVTDPNGHVTDTGYDIRGNAVSTTTCQDQAAEKCSTSYSSYQPNDTSPTETPSPTDDLVSYYRDPRSSSPADTTYQTTYEYDPLGELTKETTPPVPGYPSGRITTYAYTDGSSTAGGASGSTVPPAGLLWKTVTSGGAVTKTLYDAHGDIVKTVNADGLTTSYTYDGIGRKTSQTVYSDTYPNGLVTSYAYDADGRVTQQTDPAVTDRVTGDKHTPQVTSTYDIDGNVLSQVTADTTGGDASRAVSDTYNSHGQKASSTDAAGAVTQYTYDGYGNLASETDPAGNVTGYAYDPNRHLLTTTLQGYTGSPPGSQQAAPLTEESRAYDPAGRLASVTDAMGRVTSYAYTDDGLTATITNSGPGGGSSVQDADTYDPAGNLITQVTDNGATTTSYAVDAASQVTSQTVDPSGLDRVTSYTYDPDDHVITQAVAQGSGSPQQTTHYTYDPMGNKTSQEVDDPGGEGPAGWWTLTQASGTTVTDTSGTGNLATASGVTWTGSGAQLSGQAGQEITTRGPVADTTGSFSVSAWVNLAAITGSDENVLSQDAGSMSGFYLGVNGGSSNWGFARPEEDENDPPDWAVAGSGATARTGTWTFLAGVFNANTGAVQLYVNGTASGSASDPTPIAASGPLEIGAEKWDGQAGIGNFDGSITNVEVYPAALSAAEVANLYGQGRGGGDITRDGLTTSWTVDQLGQVVTQTNPDGIATDYSYDEAGAQTVVTGPPVSTQIGGGAPVAARPVTTTGYNTFGEVTESQDPDGNTTTYGYDADGRQVSQALPDYTPPGGPSPVSGTSTTTYNTLGEVTAQADPLGNTTHYSYDQLGDRTSETYPNDGVTTTSYDADGEVLSQTGPTGAQATATYDYLGRQLTATDVERYPSPASYTTTASYAPTSTDPSGTWKSSVTSPDGTVTGYGYDPAGETTQSTDGAGDTTRFSYDALGRQVKTVYPDGTAQTVTYDPPGNQVAQASLDATGTTLATTSAAYNGEGQQLSATDALGNATAYTYDPDGNLTAETQPVTDTSGIVTSFGYDAAGNQTRYTDGNGSSWLTTYNSWDLPESQVEPSTSQYSSAADSTTTIAYNGDGQPASVTEPGGVTVADTYDSMEEVTGQSGSGATAPTATRSFTYDAAGDMLTAATSSTAASGQPSNATGETFTYDDRGLPLTASGSAGSTSYTWNGDRQQTAVADAAGTASYTYDSAGRLHTMADPASGSTLTYSYNPMSQVSQVSYGGSGADTQAFGYDSLHRLNSDTLASGAATVASISYGYNADGYLTSKTTAGFAGASANTYGYDQADRLTSWNNGTATTTYAYDGTGDRTRAGNTTYTYDVRDELTSDGTGSYTYSANGDLTSVTGPSGTVTSTSDAYGQQGAQGSQANAYDALGRDVQLTAAGGAATTLSYEGATGQLASDGAYDYTWTPGGTLTGTAGAGSPGTGVLDLTDRHTDLTGQFTPAGTALTGSRAYGPWGAATAAGGTLAGSLGYQSQYTSPTTGQVDMGARWYNPATGSFGNKDTVANRPVPDSASASPFGYASDNPLDLTDPSGHIALNPDGTQSVTAAAAAAAAYRASVARAAPKPAPKPVLDAHQLHLAHLAHLAAIGQTPAKTPVAKPVPKPAPKPYTGPVVCPPGGLNQCIFDAYRAGGGQLDANGIPDGRGYVAPRLSPAQVKQQDDAARHARQQAAADLKAAAKTASKPAPKPPAAGGTACNSVLSRLASGPCAVPKVSSGGGGVPSWLKAAVRWAGNATGVTNAINCVRSPSWSQCLQAAVKLGLTVVTIATAGGTSELEIAAGAEGTVEGVTAAEEEGSGLIDAAESCLTGGKSFTAGTKVLLASGAAVPISQLKPGDMVLATNTGTGKTSPEAVSAVEVNHDHDLYDLKVKTSHGTGVIHTTSNHLFYDPYLKQWRPAGKLKKGEHLKTPDGTVAVADGGATPKVHDGWMWDLTVPGNNDHNFYVLPAANGSQHTYHVLAGTTPILVHNSNGDVCGVSPALSHTADMGEIHGADFASEFRSPSGQVYHAYNTEYVELPEGLKDIIRENDHPAFVCSEMKCLAKAYTAEGPAAMNGGRMTTVFVSDTEMGEHATIASPCPGCRRVLNSRLIQIMEGGG